MCNNILYHHIYKFLCLICVFSVVSSSCKYRYASTCQKQTFIPVAGQYSSGPLILEDGPFTVKDCIRLCRQYLDCTGFNMLWTDDVKSSGFCQFISVFRTDGFITHANATFYGEYYYINFLKYCIFYGKISI